MFHQGRLYAILRYTFGLRLRILPEFYTIGTGNTKEGFGFCFNLRFFSSSSSHLGLGNDTGMPLSYANRSNFLTLQKGVIGSLSGRGYFSGRMCSLSLSCVLKTSSTDPPAF